ncbi:MAG: LLM class flavin-dependent oxidoreductase [Alphaproteobacteria bacterium]|nr:LLM class flavin-dependent oxidoreductase [Alphaproteobacteria bacterium]MBV9375286.1 LLM class flavin-dependent oxidoreductase [Alphaproteobacteria bacterium]
MTFRSKYIPAEITEMTMQPFPARRIPIWFGARSEVAYQHTVRIGDGWHGSQQTPEEAAPVIEGAGRIAARI